MHNANDFEAALNALLRGEYANVVPQQTQPVTETKPEDKIPEEA